MKMKTLLLVIALLIPAIALAQDSTTDASYWGVSSVNGKVYGPYPARELCEYLPRISHVWRPGLKGWVSFDVDGPYQDQLSHELFSGPLPDEFMLFLRCHRGRPLVSDIELEAWAKNPRRGGKPIEGHYAAESLPHVVPVDPPEVVAALKKPTPDAETRFCLSGGVASPPPPPPDWFDNHKDKTGYGWAEYWADNCPVQKGTLFLLNHLYETPDRATDWESYYTAHFFDAPADQTGPHVKGVGKVTKKRDR